MKSLITGSRGAVGSYLWEELEKEPGAEVWGMSRPDCDMTDLSSVLRVLDEARPEVIYHCASIANVKKSWEVPETVLTNNIQITINLFEALRRLDIKPIVVLCSTSEVYGSSSVPMSEDFPIHPDNYYAISKVCQEYIGRVHSAAYGGRLITTRAFGYINPRRADLSLTSFARQIAEIESGQRDVLKHGNLATIRSFCDVRDIVKAYVLASKAKGTVYNIGSEQEVALGDVMDILCSLAKRLIPMEFDPKLSRPLDVTKVIPNCYRFRKATGWEPKIVLKDSLQWLLNEQREIYSAK